MYNGTQRRVAKSEKLRAIEENGKRTIGGYAVVFNALSENLGFSIEVREQVRPGAFAESLARDQQMAFWNHNMDLPIGSTRNQSLRLKEDDFGLAFEIDLPDTTTGRDVFQNVREGIVDSMSFGFQIQDEKDEEITLASEPNLPVIITVLRAKLLEVSPVVYPAYPQTEVSARKLDEAIDQRRKLIDSKLAEAQQKAQSLRARQVRIERGAKLQQDFLNIE